MITYYTEEDLTSFGNYLLSDERKQTITALGFDEAKTEARLSAVRDTDIQNWKKSMNNPEQINN